jgi:hypothetical protein
VTDVPDFDNSSAENSAEKIGHFGTICIQLFGQKKVS